MKILGLAVGALCIISAHAQPVTLRITGSTAGRGQAYDAIRALYGAGLTNQNPAHPGARTQNRVTFQGSMATPFGTRSVTIRTGYNGSAEGVQFVTAGTPVSFLLNPTNGVATLTNEVADFAMSDVFQNSTDFKTPVLSETTDTATGKPGIMVLPFQFVRGNTCSAGVSNITAQLLTGMAGIGYLPLFQFTGNPLDSDIVNLVGRNNGSGTRITVLRETTSGQPALSSITQRKASGGVWVDEPAGFSSGSVVATNINGTSLSTEGFPGGAVGYMGPSDATTSVAGGGVALPYNGVHYTKDNVRNGFYTLWGYYHMLHLSSLGTDGGSFRDAFKAQVNAGIAADTTVVQMDTMAVGRLDDGAVVTP